MIAIFTTKTLHHIYFVNELLKKNKILCILEKSKIVPPFKTKVDFENKRENYEKKKWFGNKAVKFNIKTYSFKDLNSKRVLKLLKKNKIKFIMVFGTKKINTSIFKDYKNKMFNFHGGNPEKYRGLDSHYWALYHKDLSSIETCMHVLNERLDTGKILFRKKIPIKSKTKIYHLRKLNTEICVKFAKKFIKLIKIKKKYKLFKQKKIGRYYSFMPASIKKTLEVK